MRYEVETDLYAGPLPLLVELAKLNLIDVFIVKLVGLTQVYLEEVKRGARHLNDLAEPLPLFGQLLVLKARGLLPAPVQPGEDEEVPIGLEELERRLKEYEQYKTVAQLLSELHALQHEHFTRAQVGETPLPDGVKEPEEPTPFEVGVSDLMTAFASVLERAQVPVYEIKAEVWTVEQKVEEIRVLLQIKRQVRFLDLFSPSKSRLELVAMFLAILELIRQRQARAIQESSFAEIVIAYRSPETVEAAA